MRVPERVCLPDCSGDERSSATYDVRHEMILLVKSEKLPLMLSNDTVEHREAARLEFGRREDSQRRIGRGILTAAR